MIDVFMCLIVFFLLVGRLAASERSAWVRLPESATGESEPTAHRLVVNIELGPSSGSPPTIVVEKEAVRLESLAALVRARLAEHSDTTVLLRADRDLPYAEVWPVIEACALGGAMEVRLAAERAP